MSPALFVGRLAAQHGARPGTDTARAYEVWWAAGRPVKFRNGPPDDCGLASWWGMG